MMCWTWSLAVPTLKLISCAISRLVRPCASSLRTPTSRGVSEPRRSSPRLRSSMSSTTQMKYLGAPEGAHERGTLANPEPGVAFRDVALLDRVRFHLSGQHAADTSELVVEVVGVGDVLERLPEQLPTGAADDL